MDNFDKFYNKALHFLSFRPRSEKEVKDYLIKQKISEELINSIINSLKEHIFLNDENFTKWWIEQRTLFRPRASRIIKMELKQKGIKKELIDEVFEKNITPDKEIAIKLAQKRIQRYKNEDRKKTYEKLFRFLGSKGFDYDTIKEVIDLVLSKEYN